MLDEVWGCETKEAFHSRYRPIHISNIPPTTGGYNNTAAENTQKCKTPGERDHEYLNRTKQESGTGELSYLSRQNHVEREYRRWDG